MSSEGNPVPDPEIDRLKTELDTQRERIKYLEAGIRYHETVVAAYRRSIKERSVAPAEPRT